MDELDRSHVLLHSSVVNDVIIFADKVISYLPVMKRCNMKSIRLWNSRWKSYQCFARLLQFVKTEDGIIIIAQSQLGACLRHVLNLISFLDGTSGSHCQPVLNRLVAWKIKKHRHLKNYHNSSKAKILFVYNNDNFVSIANNFNTLSADMESWTLWSNVRHSN